MYLRYSVVTNGIVDYSESTHTLSSNRKPPPTPRTTSIVHDNSDFYSFVNIIRSNWSSASETTRLEHLEQFKQLCEKHLQLIRTKYLSSNLDSEFHHALHTFLTSILDLLSYLASIDSDLSIKIKLVLSTCLGWLIKHAQVTYCGKNFQTICTIFKNILANGQSNNRQLAVSVLLVSSSS